MTGKMDVDRSPVSAIVRVRAIPKAGSKVEISADAEQRAVLARIHGLSEVKSFSASLVAMNWSNDSVRLTGRITAKIIQQCVVTLEPLSAEINEEIDLVLVPERSGLDPYAAAGGELTLEPDGPDEPEMFSGDTFDAGAIAEEYFSLAIDPYPRVDNAVLDKSPGGDGDEPPAGPFAGLAALKRRQ